MLHLTLTLPWPQEYSGGNIWKVSVFGVSMHLIVPVSSRVGVAIVWGGGRDWVQTSKLHLYLASGCTVQSWWLAATEQLDSKRSMWRCLKKMAWAGDAFPAGHHSCHLQCPQTTSFFLPACVLQFCILKVLAPLPLSLNKGLRTGFLSFDTLFLKNKTWEGKN